MTRRRTPATLRSLFSLGSLGVPLVVPPPDIELLTSAEVAGWLGVKPRTVLAWAHTGKVGSFTTPGGDRRYPRAGIARVAAELGIPTLPPPASPSGNGSGDGADGPGVTDPAEPKEAAL